MNTALRTAVLSFVLLASAATAQDPVLRQRGGILGETLDYELSGPAGAGYVLLPSRGLVNVPTPAGVIEVNTILIGIARVGILAGGTATESFPLPLSVDLAGAPVHAQFATWPGTTYPIAGLSNRVTSLVGFHGSALGIGTTTPNRHEYAAVAPLDDGRLLISGGVDAQGAVAFLELFDPGQQNLVLSAAQHAETKGLHSATTLTDGRVLLAGGWSGPGLSQQQTRATVELYDPATDSLSPTASLPSPRLAHTATRLDDGRVLVVGGLSSYLGSGFLFAALNSLDTWTAYDPATGTWGPELPLPLVDGGLYLHAATKLDDGRVLVTGSGDARTDGASPVGFSSVALLFDPQNDAWTAVAPMLTPRRSCAAVLLPDGSVLVGGGEPGLTGSCERYDPGLDAWAPGPSLNVGYEAFAMFERGGVVLAVGTNLTTSSIFPLAVERLAPPYAAWTPAPPTVWSTGKSRFAEFQDGERVLVHGTFTQVPAGQEPVPYAVQVLR